MIRGGLRRGGVSLIEIVVVLGILLFLLAFFLPIIFRVRGQADRLRGQNNLRQIGIAAHAHHDTNRRFPPIVGGEMNTPPGSLLFHLLPYVEQDQLFRKQSVWNDGVISVPVAVYLDPRDKSAPAENRFDGWLATSNYAGSWPLFGHGGGRFVNISDGTSNTMMFTERYQVCNGTPCSWGYDRLYYWAPVFGYYSDGKFQNAPAARDCNPGLPQGLDADGINVCLADGSARLVRDSVSPQTWQHVLTPAGNELIAADWND